MSDPTLTRAADLLRADHPELAAELRALAAPAHAERNLYAHPQRIGVTGLLCRVWTHSETKEQWAEILWSDRKLSDVRLGNMTHLRPLERLTPDQAREWEQTVLWGMR